MTTNERIKEMQAQSLMCGFAVNKNLEEEE